jgi:gamma-glutamylcyclotransferase (GGCT)/AIG2-like uncharacterized protein YtfP
MSDLLFVYGSLLTRIGHPQGERLRRDASLIGDATLRGRLFRVSWYPGVVRSDTPGDLVHGEVYRLYDPVASLAWLDAYEGIVAGPESVAALDEYVRTICDVRLSDGTEAQAFVYIYQRAVDTLVRLEGGRWIG